VADGGIEQIALVAAAAGHRVMDGGDQLLGLAGGHVEHLAALPGEAIAEVLPRRDEDGLEILVVVEDRAGRDACLARHVALRDLEGALARHGALRGGGELHAPLRRREVAGHQAPSPISRPPPCGRRR
jgi:hypothetical protein